MAERGVDVERVPVAVRWRRAETTLWRRTLDGIVVLPFDRAAPLALRGSAARIWDLLAQPLTVQELLDEIATIYDVEGDAVADEVGRALDELAGAGALRRL